MSSITLGQMEICLVSEKVLLLLHRTFYLTSHIRGQIYQTGDISTVESLLVFF